MFPIRDDNPTRRLPVLTVLLIAINVVVFLLELNLSADQRAVLVRGLGVVPARLAHREYHWSLLSLITSQFLHGGVLHLGGNMLYLWIFGNNIEDHLGRLLFIPFYLACGMAGGIAQALAQPLSQVPAIGASGAIAGILGAYLVLYPRAKVHTVVFLLFFIRIIPLPAALWLAIWFLLQAISAAAAAGREGGVAWFAHLGGFLFGLLVVLIFVPRPKVPRESGEFGGLRLDD